MNDEWLKPQTVFAAFFYYTYIIMISFGNPVPSLLEKIVGGLMLFYYGNKIVKNLAKGKQS